MHGGSTTRSRIGREGAANGVNAREARSRQQRPRGPYVRVERCFTDHHTSASLTRATLGLQPTANQRVMVLCEESASRRRPG